MKGRLRITVTVDVDSGDDTPLDAISESIEIETTDGNAIIKSMPFAEIESVELEEILVIPRRKRS